MPNSNGMAESAVKQIKWIALLVGFGVLRRSMRKISFKTRQTRNI